MAKLFALLTTAAALVAGVQAAGCPANRRLCGHTLIDQYQCAAANTLIFITPQGNDPRDCIYPISSGGEPIADGPGGVSCCAVGRCFTTGTTSQCG